MVAFPDVPNVRPSYLSGWNDLECVSFDGSARWPAKFVVDGNELRVKATQSGEVRDILQLRAVFLPSGRDLPSIRAPLVSARLLGQAPHAARPLRIEGTSLVMVRFEPPGARCPYVLGPLSSFEFSPVVSSRWAERLDEARKFAKQDYPNAYHLVATTTLGVLAVAGTRAILGVVQVLSLGEGKGRSHDLVEWMETLSVLVGLSFVARIAGLHLVSAKAVRRFVEVVARFREADSGGGSKDGRSKSGVNNE